jgi:S1-C subfamily serine protease
MLISLSTTIFCILHHPQLALSTKTNVMVEDSLLPLLYNRTQDSVVLITTKVNPVYLHRGPLATGTSASSESIDVPVARGSGFVYDKEGHIITNYHVLQGGTSVDVRFMDGNSYSARLIGKDPYSDLAVLQLDPLAIYNQRLIPLSLGNSSLLKVGQHAVAIGNPLGFSGTMTEGIISQLNAIIPVGGIYHARMIQIDVPTTHGNSGGPLLNLDGQVIGITELGLPQVGFLNFAIPADKVAKVVPQLISNGTYKNVWLGISGTDVTPDIAKAVGLNQAKGVIVIYVTPDSPAYTAGVRSGNNENRLMLYGSDSNINSDADIVVGIDDKQVRQQGDLLNYIDSKSPGDQVTLKVVRNKLILDLRAVLTERPSG